MDSTYIIFYLVRKCSACHSPPETLNKTFLSSHDKLYTLLSLERFFSLKVAVEKEISTSPPKGQRDWEKQLGGSIVLHGNVFAGGWETGVRGWL